MLDLKCRLPRPPLPPRASKPGVRHAEQLGFAGVWAAPLLPAQVTPIVQQDLWSMFGWTTFEALSLPFA